MKNQREANQTGINQDLMEQSWKEVQELKDNINSLVSFFYIQIENLSQQEGGKKNARNMKEQTIEFMKKQLLKLELDSHQTLNRRKSSNDIESDEKIQVTFGKKSTRRQNSML